MHEDKGIEILVVEDSPTQAAQLKFILENHKYTVSIARDGKEALQCLQKHKPALIISDILMPEMDGYELCRKIKETPELKNISVILLTTLSDPEDVIKGLECGADNFVTKPFDEVFLLSQINYMVANDEVRKDTAADLSLNITFKSKRYSINSNRLQIFNLLLSTYETAIYKNNDLLKTESELKELNRTLEEKVNRRTTALRSEIEERKRVEQTVHDRLKMEAIISSISTSFIDFESQKIDELINRALRQIGEFINVDRSNLFLLSEDGTKISNTHEWCAVSVEPLIDRFKNISVDNIPWTMEKLRAFQNIHIYHIHDLPEEASAEKKIVQMRGIQSFLIVPMIFKGTLKGFLGFDSVNMEKKWTEADINLLKIIGVIIVTALERNKEENLLRESEERFFTILNSSPGIMALNRFSDGRYVYVNDTFSKITGFDKEEVIGRSASELNLWVEPADRILLRKTLLEEHKSVLNYEMQFRLKSGEIHVVLASAEFLDFHGERYILNAASDITEHKQMEQMVIQSEKMASLGTLAAGVAHEINNPIGYIGSNLKTLQKYHGKLVTYTSKLQKIFESNPEISEEINNLSKEYKIDFILNDLKAALEESIEGTEKVKKIVSDLRDFSHIKKAQIINANINDGIEKTVNVIGNELKYKAEVIKEFGDLPEIECDIHQLNQVFLNILINAVHAIEKQGTIKIKTFSPGNYIVVQISDTGTGISKANINKIFDAFFTTKEPGKGTGLGLSITYKIIQEHNGIINVESEVGKGTTFTIKLPVQHSQKLKEIKVLIVDDNENICDVLKELIINHNPLLTVKTAASGFEVADLLNVFKPHIVLLNFNMPGMDGFEVLRRIKTDEHTIDTKVIMTTGDIRDGLKEKSFQLGACEFLMKPIKSEILYETLDKIILEV